MNDIKVINAGYNGYVFIVDNNEKDFNSIGNTVTKEFKKIPLQVLSANVTRQYNIPTFTPFYQKYEIEKNSIHPYSVIRGAKGTCSFNGSISFQLTQGALDYFFKNTSDDNQDESLFFNKNSFTIIIYDGLNSVQVKNCIWQSISIQCEPNSLITMSINFQSLNGHEEEFQEEETNEKNIKNFDNSLIPYWQSGAENMLSFQLNMERNVTPVYLNNDFVTPTYLRVGLISVNISANYYEKQSFNDSSTNSSSSNQKDMIIKIGDKILTISGMVLQSENFTMSSMQDIGTKSYQWKSIPLKYNVPLIKIQKPIIKN